MSFGSFNPFPSVAVLGPGLIGGSLVMAVRECMPGAEIRLWARRESPLQFAKERGLADLCTQSLGEAVQHVNLIVLATPTGTYSELGTKFVEYLDKDAIVTDVGSTKGNVHAGIGSFLKKQGHLFIGSHPMAGSEKQGIEHARPDLFKGAVVALTTDGSEDQIALDKLRSFWEQLGAAAIAMDPHSHDEIVAAISHVPHLMAALTARTAISPDIALSALGQMAATGFCDTTRVCSGSPELWTDILTQNAEAICPCLERSIADQRRVLQLLQEKNCRELQQWLAEAKRARESIC